MVTQNHQIISSHELRKNGGNIARFWNQEIQELKENSENQNAEKRYIDLAQCLDQLGRKQELQNQFARLRAKQLDENKHMVFDDWTSQIVV